MWLYVPSQSARAKPGSSSACTSAESNWPLSATWNGKPMRRRTLPALLKRAPCLMRLSGLTCGPSAMHASALSWKASNSTCSRADTPASRSVSRADSVVRTILDIFGQPLLRRLARIGRRSAFSRMSQLTLNLGIPKCEPTFEQWATELRKDCSQRANSAAAIVASGFSSWLWPTAKANEHTTSSPAAKAKGYRTLHEEVLAWRSPSGQEPGIATARLEGAMGHRFYDKETGRLAQYGLTQQVQMWPTAAASDAIRARMTPETLIAGRDKQQSRPKGMPKQLATEAADFQLSRPAPANSTDGEKSSKPGRTSRPRLNPAFVGWLMGFPCDWTHIEATGCAYMATQLSRWSRRMRGYFYGLISSMARRAADGDH